MKIDHCRLHSIAFYASLFALVLLFGACAPDLIVKNVHHEQFLLANLAMKGTIENQGQKASGESITTLEIRSNSNDPFIPTSRISTPSLRPSESKELLLWTFPSTLIPPQARCLQVRVCADADNTVTESSETNNCIIKSFPEVCP